MIAEQTKILGKQKIEAKIKRIAYQIAENNFKEKEILIVGIQPNGSVLAKKILKELDEIVTKKTHYLTIKIDDKKSIEKLKTDIKNIGDIKSKTIVVIDDVANTGETLIFAIKPLLKFNPKKIQTAVLVDRKHKNFPIKSDFIGLQLSTNLQEYIKVDLVNMEVFLQ